jgi:D-sedoheptulose 7-phosphate isomerase
MKKKNKSQNGKEFIKKYYLNFIKSIKNIDEKLLLQITNLISEKIKKKSQIFVAGNGGSSSVANHFLCDFNKGVMLSSKYKLKPKIISLSNSIEMITAISNDISYDEIFTLQLKNYVRKGDCIICFSCSGKSKNILNLIKYANQNKIDVILFQGFGSKAKNIKTKFYINLKHENYGITEDIFSSTMHVMSQYIRAQYTAKNQIL